MSTLKLLFTTFDGGGNVAPIMKVVAELVRRGHAVRVMSERVNRDEADAAGAAFVSWTRAPSKAARSRDLEPSDWAAATPEEGVREMVQHFLCGLALAYAQDVIEELEREPADLVINFDMLLGVMAACEARGQKLALLSTMLSMFPLPGVPPFGPGLMPAKTDAECEVHAQIARATSDLFDSGLPTLNAARATLGLPPLQHVFDQANAATIRWLGTARAFDFAPEAPPPYVRYVGPLIRDPAWATSWANPWPRADSRPLVVVAFSTSFQNHAACVQRIIDACEGLPVRVLVTLGGSLRPNEVVPAANAHVAESAPHTEVMQEASLVITHGGHGSVMTALIARLPLLVIPHGRDQTDNAARVVARGAGLMLTSSAPVEELRASIKRLLDEPSFRSGARRLGDAIAEEVRSSTLVEEIEALARAGRSTVDRRTALKGLAAAVGTIPLRSLRARTIDPAAVTALQRSISGEVVPIGAAAYARTREEMTWNQRKTSRTPSAIVRVRSAQDVCAAVRFAAKQGLKVAVRSGGHNYHSSPVRDGGLLLDLSALDALQVDAPNLQASVQPAVKSGALVSALTPLGLAFPVGHCADVALGGFLLNGGVGWNVGVWGPSCMSVRGIELVTADGELVYADEHHNRDLFWAARGAGPGFFAVATRFDLDLHRLPAAIGVRTAEFDLASALEVGEWVAELAAGAPAQMEIVCVLGANGPLPRRDGRACSLLVAAFTFADSESQGREWLAAIDSHPSQAQLIGKSPFEAATIETLQRANDESFPNGSRMSGDHCWSNAAPRQLLAAVREIAASAPSGPSFLFFSPNTVRIDLAKTADAAAFSMAGALYFGAYGFWSEPRADRVNLQWVRAAMAAAEPLSVGQYVGEADLSVSADRATRCFSPAAWQKLQALRVRYDPAGVFFPYLR